MNKLNCFAMMRGQCEVLIKTCCNGCHFFKTKEDIKEGLKMVNERLRDLPVKSQRTIADKYHEGCMFWHNGPKELKTHERKIG